jgi:hypothetical protein
VTIRKIELFRALWDRQPHVDILLDPRVAGVVVPLEWKGRPQMRLAVTEGPNPVRDLLVTEAGLSGVFSFNGAPFYVHIPWKAIAWMGYGDRGLVWYEDLPADWPSQKEEAKTPTARAAARGWKVLEGGLNGEPSGPNTRGVA